MTTIELRSFLQRVDDPYFTTDVPNSEVSFLNIEPMNPRDGVVGMRIFVDEWYFNGEERRPDDNEEVVGVCRIEVERQPDGGYKCKVTAEDGYNGDLVVVETMHPDAL